MFEDEKNKLKELNEQDLNNVLKNYEFKHENLKK